MLYKNIRPGGLIFSKINGRAYLIISVKREKRISDFIFKNEMVISYQLFGVDDKSASYVSQIIQRLHNEPLHVNYGYYSHSHQLDES